MVTKVETEKWLWEYDCETQTLRITDADGNSWHARRKVIEVAGKRPNIIWQMYYNGERFGDEQTRWDNAIKSVAPRAEHQVCAAVPALSASGCSWEWTLANQYGLRDNLTDVFSRGYRWFDVARYENEDVRFLVQSRFGFTTHRLVAQRVDDKLRRWTCINASLSLDEAYRLAESIVGHGFTLDMLSQLAYVDAPFERLSLLLELKRAHHNLYHEHKYDEEKQVVVRSRLHVNNGGLVSGWVNEVGKVKYTIRETTLGEYGYHKRTGVRVVFKNRSIEDFVDALKQYPYGARVSLEPQED